MYDKNKQTIQKLLNILKLKTFRTLGDKDF